MSANLKRTNTPDNTLLENSMDIFHLLTPIISGDRGATADRELRARLLQSFDAFEKRCHASQLDNSAVGDVKYALSAVVDEMVMNSAWPHKLSWAEKPLQLEFFSENLADEGFYQKLDKLRQSGERNIDALEIYYLCLQLGFMGMYRMRGEMEQLHDLQENIRMQIAGCRFY
jgi:type VI secretion system protein ImpK